MLVEPIRGNFGGPLPVLVLWLLGELSLSAAAMAKLLALARVFSEYYSYHSDDQSCLLFSLGHQT